jgi:hypothetical protein
MLNLGASRYWGQMTALLAFWQPKHPLHLPLNVPDELHRTTAMQDCSSSSSAVNQAVPLQLTQCPLLNVSMCQATVANTRRVAASSINKARSNQAADHSAGLLVVAYNSLAWPRMEFVRVPVTVPPSALAIVVQGTRQVGLKQLAEMKANMMMTDYIVICAPFSVVVWLWLLLSLYLGQAVPLEAAPLQHSAAA